MQYVYILRCATGELYVGMTGDLESRVARHNDGTAGRFTRAAVARERQIKRWTRAKTEALIAGNFRALHVMSTRRKP
jgi:putative endonuclease